MKFLLIQNRSALILLSAVLQIALFSGCLPFSDLTSTTVTNLSNKPPYKSYVGNTVITKINGSIWNCGIRLGSGEDIPSYRTDLKKIADLPVGTKIKIHSVKHIKSTSEMGGDDSTWASCTVYFEDGRKMDCRANWGFLIPLISD
jgi:hypothetical protein